MVNGQLGCHQSSSFVTFFNPHFKGLKFLTDNERTIAHNHDAELLQEVDSGKEDDQVRIPSSKTKGVLICKSTGISANFKSIGKTDFCCLARGGCSAKSYTTINLRNHLKRRHFS